jgi:septal ring factor EnvC (AmiA/AmiB activator)
VVHVAGEVLTSDSLGVATAEGIMIDIKDLVKREKDRVKALDINYKGIAAMAGVAAALVGVLALAALIAPDDEALDDEDYRPTYWDDSDDDAADDDAADEHHSTLYDRDPATAEEEISSLSSEVSDLEGRMLRAEERLDAAKTDAEAARLDAELQDLSTLHEEAEAELSRLTNDWFSDPEQDEIVNRLAVEVESLSDEEYDDLFNQLDEEHQMEALDNVRDFANGAVGSDDWDRS